MCSQNLENSYQVTVMNESESMSLHDESQENHFPLNPEDAPEPHMEDDSSSEERSGEEEAGTHMEDESAHIEDESAHIEDESAHIEEISSEEQGASHKKKEHREGYTAQ